MDTSKKIYGLVTLIIVVVSAIAVILLLRTGAPSSLMEDFEQNLGETNFGEWSAHGDVPPDPNNPGFPVEWNIKRISNVSHSGSFSAELFIDGRQDDGTIWLERKIAAKPNSQLQLVVSFYLYSREESFNTIAAVVAYAGTAKPTAEQDFDVIGNSNEVTGWKNYAHNVTVNSDSNGEVYIAVGISVRWETYMSFFIDDIVVEQK